MKPLSNPQLSKLLLALFALSVASGCAEEDQPANLVLISIDSLRADHVHTYGYDRETSPNLDAFGEGGVVFEEALSPTAWTLQGHASMLSGRTPRVCMTSEENLRVREQVPLLAELLKAKGYRTGAVHSAHFLKAEFGFDRGFDSYQFFKNKKSKWDLQDEANRKLIASVGQEPFFLFFHFMSVHTPYDPPKEHSIFERPYSGVLNREKNGEQVGSIFEGEMSIDEHDRDYLIDLYDQAIHHTDRRVGALLQELYDHIDLSRTYIMITSDHGEEFMEHSSILHTRTLYEEVLRIPMMLRGPTVPNGARVTTRASLVDVVPTLLELLSLPAPPGLNGQSLVPSWGPDATDPPPLELATYYPKMRASKWGLRTSTHKLVLDMNTGEKFLFDLEADPEELINLYPSPESEELEALLRQHSEPKYGTEMNVSAEDLEELRQLGYVE